MTRSDTTDRLLSAATELASRSGYHGFGINQVLELADAGNGSLYHCFPDGKAELVSRAITVEADRVTTAMRTLMERGVVAGIRAFYAVAEHELRATDFAHGCRVTTAMADGADVDAVREAGASALDSWSAAIRDALVAGGADRRAAAGTASALISLYIGAWISCRTTRSTAPMRAARDAALALAGV